MASNFDELICALSESDIKHVVKEPIALSRCGHSACRACLPIQSKPKCKICGLVTNRDLTNDKVSKGLQQLIKSSLDKLLVDLEKQATAYFLKLKTYVTDKPDSIDLHIKYIEDEVEIRVESVKAELDKIHERFKSDLNLVRMDLKGKLSEMLNNSDYDTEYFEKSLTQLRNDIENKNQQNEERFYAFQDDLIKLKQRIRELNTKNYELQFFPSLKKIDEKIIGDVVYENSQTHVRCIRDLRLVSKKSISSLKTDMKTVLRRNEYKTLKLSVTPFDICVLPNNHLLCANYYQKNLTEYNENLKLVKTIAQIDHENIYPRGIAVNPRDQLYICDNINCRIILTDLDYNKVKTFGSQGDGEHQLNYPQGICFKNDRLYVCDGKNCRIQILTSDLEYISSIQLDDWPFTINVLDNIAFISSDKILYVYDFDAATIRFAYENKDVGRISRINRNFYTFDKNLKKLYIYDYDGIFNEELDVDWSANIFDGNIFCFSGRLIFCFNKSFHIFRI